MSSLKKNLVCIVCPRGCRLTLTLTLPEDGLSAPETIGVEGNGCPRGAEYARQELTAPRRVLTSTVRLSGGAFPRLPVKTSRSVPKDTLRALMRLLDGVEASAPVHTGDVLIKDALGTGADIVATRDAESL